MKTMAPLGWDDWTALLSTVSKRGYVPNHSMGTQRTDWWTLQVFLIAFIVNCGYSTYLGFVSFPS